MVVFFGTVVMWMLPGVAGLFTDAAWGKTLNGFGITFWAIISSGHHRDGGHVGGEVGEEHPGGGDDQHHYDGGHGGGEGADVGGDPGGGL